MALVIGLNGAKGVGKNYFYEVVKKNYPNLDIRQIAYADPIKKEVCKIFELRDEQQYDLFKRSTVEYKLPDFINHTVLGRQVVREIGMLMRSYDETQFVRYVEGEITKAPSAIWCVTDVRFKNEFKSIRSITDGVIVKIKRTNYSYDGHITETEFDDKKCDIVIHNNSDIQVYEKVVLGEFQSLLDRGDYSVFR